MNTIFVNGPVSMEMGVAFENDKTMKLLVTTCQHYR